MTCHGPLPMLGGSFWKVTVASLAVMSPQMCSGRQMNHRLSRLDTGSLQITLKVYSSTSSARSTPPRKVMKAEISFSMM